MHTVHSSLRRRRRWWEGEGYGRMESGVENGDYEGQIVLEIERRRENDTLDGI